MLEWDDAGSKAEETPSAFTAGRRRTAPHENVEIAAWNVTYQTWSIQFIQFFYFSTTWDEHIFELTLPRSCCVGHVDVKFSLHSLPSMATEIQVTLLKLNSSGIGKRDKQVGSKAVDDGINFKLSGTFNFLFFGTNL
jgi:hypothetical protein